MPTPHKTAVFTLEQGQELYNRVRAGFILQDTNLTAWCRANNIFPQNATLALRGGWRGPKSQQLAARVAKAAGVLEDAA